MKTILTQLKALTVIISRIEPYSDLTDAAIYLGGEHDGIYLSIGDGYYSVVKECADGKLMHVMGNGNVAEEIKQAMED